MNDPKDLHPSGLSHAEIWHWYSRYPSLLAKFAFYGLIIIITYVALNAISSVLFPVLLSLLIAYLLDPTVDWFEARGFSRTLAIGVILLIGFGGIGVLGLFLYPTIAHQIGNVIEGAPKLLNSARNDLLPWLENNGVAIPTSAKDAFASYGETVAAKVPELAKTVTSSLWSIVGQLGSAAASAINLVMIPVFTFYFLRDFDSFRQRAIEFIPEANRAFYVSRAQRVDAVVGAWFRGQVEVALILAALYALGLAIVFELAGIGISAGIAIGALAGILNIIPYFGFLIGFVLSILMVLLEWNGVWPIGGVLLVFFVVQNLEGYVITPRIVGEKVGLSPVTVIIALLVGGEVLGLLGVLLALPIAGGLRVLLPDALAYYRASPIFTGRLDPEAPKGFIAIALAAEAEVSAFEGSEPSPEETEEEESD